MGHKSQSDRPAPADQPHLGQPLVRRRATTMRQLLKEDLKMRKFIMDEPAAGGDLQGGDRASGQAVPRVDLCRASRCHHRQEGRRHREAAQPARQDDQERRQAQHRRDPQARSRRQARRPGHRRSAGPPRGVPPGDEARDAVGACVSVPKASRSPAAAVSAAPRSPASNGIAKAACRCTRCAPTSTTPKPRR